MPIIRNVRLEQGSLVLEGYPEGSTVHGLVPEIGDQLSRLFLFRNDLADVMQWVAEIEGDNLTWNLRQALAIAATIKFCGCFESTQGHRKQPLKPKLIFSPDDRVRLKGVVAMRNKIVAHDDQVFPAHSSLIILDGQGLAIEAVGLGMRFNISDMPAFHDMGALATRAFEWTCDAFEDVARGIVEVVNRQPLELRLATQAEPKFTIAIQDKEME